MDCVIVGSEPRPSNCGLLSRAFGELSSPTGPRHAAEPGLQGAPVTPSRGLSFFRRSLD
jgi:hypothetical protein